MLIAESQETPNLSGGINTGLHASLIGANELASLINFYVKGDSIYPRLPSSLKSQELEVPLSIGSYKTFGDRFKFIVAKQDGVSILTPGETELEIPLTCRYGVPFTSVPENRPFHLQGQFCNYLIDPLGGPLRRVTGSYYEDAGIPAPTTAPVIALNAVGVMTVATYNVVVTFYNSATDDESDFSPVSNNLVLGANDSIDVSAIPVSTTPQVDKVKIYVTPPDQTNLRLYAGKVNNGVTTFNINLTPLQLGTILSTTNGVPPTGVKAGAFFDNSLFLTDGVLLYKSKYQQYETFDVENDSQPVFQTDGHDCVILYPWGGRLVAGKNNYLVYFTPTGTGDYVPTVLSDKYGVYSPHAMKSVENLLIWFDGVNFQRSNSGSTPENISDIRIKRYLDAIPTSKKNYLSAEIAPRLNCYIVKVPQANDSYITLAYNYKVGAWSVFTYLSPLMFIAEGYDVNQDRQVYALNQDNYLTQLFDPSVMEELRGESISYYWLSRGYKASKSVSPGSTLLRRIALLTTPNTSSADLRVYEGGNLVNSINESTIYMYDIKDDWKVAELHTLGQSSGSPYIQVEFEMSGYLPPDFRISKLYLELVQSPYVKQYSREIGV